MNNIRRIFAIIFSVVLVVGLIACIVTVIHFQKTFNLTGDYCTYDCNVKILSLSTKIEIKKQGDDFGMIEGKIVRFVTDPLNMFDSNGNQIGYAGDTYQFIGQDNHSIYVNNNFICDMIGEWAFLGEEYKLYDNQRNYLGYLRFAPGNLIGALFDKSGELVAKYSSGIFRRDYTVEISNNCQIDECAIMLMFASFYSDYKYDSSSSHRSSN